MLGYIDLSWMLTSPGSGRTLLFAGAGALALYSQRKRLGGLIGGVVSKLTTKQPVTPEKPDWEDRIQAYRLISECLQRDGLVDVIAQLEKDVLPCLVRDEKPEPLAEDENPKAKGKK